MDSRSLLPGRGFRTLPRMTDLLRFVQPLHNCRNNNRQSHGGIDENFAKHPAFRWWYKLAPRDRLAVRAARQASPIDWFRTDAQPVMISLQGDVFPQTPVTQLAEWPKLLGPVPWYTTADGENTQLLLTQQSRSEVLQIFKRIEADLMPAR